MGLRSENGQREVADRLHSKYNKQLQCPACDFKCTSNGAFNKDSGGTRDHKGDLYRRFKCRRRDRCTKTLGVTQFLAMCKKLGLVSTLDQLPILTASRMYNLSCLFALLVSSFIYLIYQDLVVNENLEF